MTPLESLKALRAEIDAQIAEPTIYIGGQNG